MNKKLIAVAVAGLFAAPVAALAQSTVTISGKIIQSFGSYKLGNATSAVAGSGGAMGNTTETLLKDDSSRILFLIREDLGGGLAAIAKYDLRAAPDSGAAVANSGESYVGLTSPSWGTIGFGRYDLHYGNHASYSGVHNGLHNSPTAIFDVAQAGAVAIARQSRTDNVIRYGSPKFADMFEVVLAYSASGNNNAGAANQEADLRSANRKGSAWNVAPKIWGKNWEAGYSYWTNKADVASANSGTTTLTTKHRGDSLYGTYVWGGLRVGLAWNKSKVDTTAAAGGATTTTSNRTAWGIPIAYNWGSHNVYADFYRARNDKAIAGDTKANLLGLTYAYDLSKRTAAALTYTRIRNGAGASYNLFTAAAPGTAPAVGALAVAPGEDPRWIALTLRHNF